MCSVAEQCSDRPGWHLYSGGNFTRKCVSTTSIEAPIYILLRAAIPPAPPLCRGKSVRLWCDWSSIRKE